MVEGYAHITIKGVTETFRLNPLEIARAWCQRAGFDVDAEPTGTGGWRITARSQSVTVTKTGGSLQEAVTKLVEDVR